jgi:predicted RNase H-like HicB family nuclease
MLLSAVITEAEEGGFVALNPETGTTTQGESLEEAMENLKEATSLYLQEFPMKIQTPPVLTTFEVSHASISGPLWLGHH